jgi:3-oxoacyl-[acyl-carrier-protein] synthase III
VRSAGKCEPPNAKLLDIASYLPEQILSNDDLAKLYPDWPAEKIFSKTGIKERHIADQSQTASDLAYAAAQKLFLQGVADVTDIDFVLLCTQAPDYVLPTTACLLQDRLGISRSAGAVDINLGCSGFVYGLSLAKGLIESGSAKCVLLLTADTYSKYIHPLDKSVRTLFGDGATASIIGLNEVSGASIGPFVFGSDGSGGKNLIVEAGGFRSPKNQDSAQEFTDSSGNTRSIENLYMDGAEVLTFSLQEVPKAINALLQKVEFSKEEVDHFVLHQANKFMLEALRKKLGVPPEKLPILMERCGNTVSSTIPLALIAMREGGKLKAGEKIVLAGFGVGYSWATCFLKY